MILHVRRGRHDDPGSAWAEAALAPMRDQRLDAEVSRSIMARIAAERARPLTLPGRLRRPRLALAACLAAGIVSFGMVMATLIILAINGDEGVREIGTLLTASGHLLAVFAQVLLTALKGILAAAIAVGRGAWILLEAAAPLFRGAELAAAACGLLSIAISFYLLARGYRSAPMIVAGSDPGGSGGPR